ncbi:conserved hypothetical protein [Oenococcus oeni]|uniref:AAA family ATPase n=1 Tax=Oenococcus oeni TaxID=1247 RepID=UPI0010B21179|nr:AAA family ATPase [Oenococcus oeni]SYW00382.1 conserved hypothetical protein [Oenococcus oeni]
MITSIDLSKLGYAFTSDSVLDGLKRVNYFYGKNGTGKSSLVREIVEQYGDNYNIQSFTGSDLLIAKNESLDAISLGQENAEVAKVIARYDKQIAELDKELLPLDHPDSGSLNLYEQQILAAKNSQALLEKRQHFYQRSARELKNRYTSLTGPNYDKNNFEQDISLARDLTEEEITNANETLSAQILDLSKVTLSILPHLQDLSKIKDAVNDILSAPVKSRVIMKEFIDQPDKQNFAYKGMQIHSRETSERCAFCGSPVSKERWEELDNYFSDEVEKLQTRISNGLKMIANAHHQVEEAFVFPQNVWHVKYQVKLNALQAASNEHRLIIVNFLDQLDQVLCSRRDAPFKKILPLMLEVPKDFTELQKSLTDLWQANSDYNQQLADQKKTSVNHLKHYYVYRLLVAEDHDGLFQAIKDATDKQALLDDQIAKKQESKNQIRALKADEIRKTTSEAQAAKEINRLVLNLGDDSFSLQPIKLDGQQKGLYQIVGRDNNPRSLKTLSTGELNLLAFLWFRYHLEDVSETDLRPRIIIFDDPVNSNDDNSQYLILAEIQELIAKDQQDQFFIFTHNNHFYVQLRPSSYKNKGVFRLRRAGKTCVIRIADPKDDLSSIYEDLWNELHFLYDHNRLVSTWNCMRRILEAYGRFNFANGSARDTENELSTSTDKVLYLSLLKSLHVNSHIGIDTDLDLSGRDIETLLYAFYDVFVNLNAIKHFIAYWGEDLTKKDSK